MMVIRMDQVQRDTHHNGRGSLAFPVCHDKTLARPTGLEPVTHSLEVWICSDGGVRVCDHHGYIALKMLAF